MPDWTDCGVPSTSPCLYATVCDAHRVWANLCAERMSLSEFREDQERQWREVDQTLVEFYDHVDRAMGVPLEPSSAAQILYGVETNMPEAARFERDWVSRAPPENRI